MGGEQESLADGEGVAESKRYAFDYMNKRDYISQMCLWPQRRKAIWKFMWAVKGYSLTATGNAGPRVSTQWTPVKTHQPPMMALMALLSVQYSHTPPP